MENALKAYKNVLTQNRYFWLLLLEHFFSHAAFYIVSFSGIVVIYQLTGSNTAVSLLLINSFLPSFLFALLAGVVADFYSKKRIMIISDLLWAFFIFLIFVTRVQPYLLLVFTFFAQGIDEFFRPAQSASIPCLLKESDLTLGNSLFAIARYCSMVIGYGIAGPLLKLDYGVPFFIAFCLGIVSFVVSLFLPKEPLLPKTFAAELKFSLFVKKFNLYLREGVKYLLVNKKVSHFVVFIAIVEGALACIVGILPDFIASWGLSPTNISTYIVLPLAVGSLVGSVFLGRDSGKKQRSYWIMSGLFMAGLCLFTLSLSSLFFPEVSDILRIIIIVLCSLLCGVGGCWILIPGNAELQFRIGEDVRGRVYGVLNMIISLFVAIMALLSGVGADLFSSGLLLLFISLIMVSFRFWFCYAKSVHDIVVDKISSFARLFVGAWRA